MNTKTKLFSMMKRYGYYCLAGILTLGLALTLSLTIGGTAPIPDQTIPVGNVDLTFVLPMENATVIKGYSDKELQYNQTLNQWEVHKGIDIASEQLSVYSVLDGVVSKVSYSYETGTKIEISHNNGFTSVYSSLSENAAVKEGDSVKKGDKIGEVADTSSRESLEGKHLHFELLQDGSKVDPANYITFEQK